MFLSPAVQFCNLINSAVFLPAAAICHKSWEGEGGCSGHLFSPLNSSIFLFPVGDSPRVWAKPAYPLTACMQSSQINESAKGVNVFFKDDHQFTKLYMTYATHLKTVFTRHS